MDMEVDAGCGEWRTWRSKRARYEKGVKAAATATAVVTAIGDLPSGILQDILSRVRDVRSRNSASLVCREWLLGERLTRAELRLRGDVCDVHMLPATLAAVETLDCADASPWGHSLFAHHPQLVCQWLRRAFPAVRHLRAYARHALDVAGAAATWPALHTLRLVRWHQRSPPLLHAGGGGGGAAPAAELELGSLAAACPHLRCLDLSHFYCWAEDVIRPLQLSPVWSAGLRALHLVKPQPEGFKAADLSTIAALCPFLEDLRALCDFDPRLLDPVDDDCLRLLAAACPRLRLLRLVDINHSATPRLPRNAAEPPQPQEEEEEEEACVSAQGLGSALRALPLLDELAVVLGPYLRLGGSGAAVEVLEECSHVSHVEVTGLQHVWLAGTTSTGAGGTTPGNAVTTTAADAGTTTAVENTTKSGATNGLRRLCLAGAASSRLCEAQVERLLQGYGQLAELSLRGWAVATQSGVERCVAAVAHSLVALELALPLDTVAVLPALWPLQGTLQRLRLECCSWSAAGCGGGGEWRSLQSVEVCVWAGELLQLGAALGGRCPQLREVSIRVEGDCRQLDKPAAREWGLRQLAAGMPGLERLRLDLSEVVGYALSAPSGKRDLSIWERFYLGGIQAMPALVELDYWPPSDKEVNYRGMSLPGAALLSQCATLRKLFIHGTTYDHLFMMLLNIPNLRDVQLRQDYYPSPESPAVYDSCRRFQALLARRGSPD